jgi:uncharacterized protein
VPGSSLDRLVDTFAREIDGVTHTALVSADGVLVAASAGLSRDRTRQLAAIAAGLTSLTVGAAVVFGAGGVVQTVIEMERGYLLLMTVGGGSHLAVLADVHCDIGVVGYEMTLLVDRVGRVADTLVRDG